MLYVGYVLEKHLDVNAIIDNVVTSDLIRMCVCGSALYHCHNWREGLFHCIACTCNCRQCCDVRPNTHVRIRVYVITLPKLEGKICFTLSHAPAVPSDTAGLCDMCAILIQGRYYSLSKTNLCLYVIK